MQSARGPVNSGRAVTRHPEPRRVASTHPTKSSISRGPRGFAKSTGMQRAVIHRAFAHGWVGRPGAVGICTQSQERGASGENSRPHAGLVEVAPRFSGRGPAAPARGWAFSSVGESARLITVRSLVRIQKGPRSEPARLLRHHLGDVAQLGEHLLCKQGVAGSSPAISTARLPAISTARLNVIQPVARPEPTAP